MTDEEILNAEKVSPKMAGDYLGKSVVWVYAALRRGVSFGDATQMPGGKWSYYISPERLIMYRRGETGVADELAQVKLQLRDMMELLGKVSAAVGANIGGI